jgi:hypothetical protein
LSTTTIGFLVGLGWTLVSGYLWLSRSKDGGDIYGYDALGDFLSPLGTVLGILMMVFALVAR